MNPFPDRTRSAFVAAPLRVIRDPVIVILLLAGIFDGISGNPIHSILLFAVAFALARDATASRAVEPAAPGSPAKFFHTPAAIAGALVYAIVVGGFDRYSWPATTVVVATATVCLAAAWRRPLRGGLERGRVEPTGAIAWASVGVALGIWELLALLLQPTLTTDSYAHPTISVLTDPALATHPGRSIALFLWLGFGWFLVQR